jgi:hypothetical protein
METGMKKPWIATVLALLAITALGGCGDDDDANNGPLPGSPGTATGRLDGTWRLDRVSCGDSAVTFAPTLPVSVTFAGGNATASAEVSQSCRVDVAAQVAYPSATTLSLSGARQSCNPSGCDTRCDDSVEDRTQTVTALRDGDLLVVTTSSDDFFPEVCYSGDTARLSFG